MRLKDISVSSSIFVKSLRERSAEGVPWVQVGLGKF